MGLRVSVEVQRLHFTALADRDVVVIPEVDLAVNGVPIPEASDIESLVVGSIPRSKNEFLLITGQSQVHIGSVVVKTEVPV